MTGTHRDALRRRIYDATRTPALQLSDSTLALAQRGGVFHLNGSEADEITEAVLAVVEPILADYDRLKLYEDADRAAAHRVRDESDPGRSVYRGGQCEDCFCCTASGCRMGLGSTCPTDRLGDSVCPCTGD